jgi:hypothetical protein
MRLKKCGVKVFDYAFIHGPHAHCDLTCFWGVEHTRRADAESEVHHRHGTQTTTGYPRVATLVYGPVSRRINNPHCPCS